MKKYVRVFAIVMIIIGLCMIGYYGWQTLDSIRTMDFGKEIFDGMKPVVIVDENNEDTEVSLGEDAVEEEDLSVYVDLVKELRTGYENDDVVGYISYEEADINYPIVQGAYNNEYLHKDAYGKYSAGGSIILDTDNSTAFDDVATIVYGHRMQSKTMFGKLENHVREVGLGENFYIYTESEKITYTTIAYGVIDSNDRSLYLITGSNGYPAFIKTISAKMEKYELCPNDNKFVSLVTCTYLSNGQKERFSVIGAEVDREPYILDSKEVGE